MSTKFQPLCPTQRARAHRHYDGDLQGGPGDGARAGGGGHSWAGYLSHGRLVLLHQLVHVLLILLQPVLDLILLTLKAAQLLLQLDRGKDRPRASGLA